MTAADDTTTSSPDDRTAPTTRAVLLSAAEEMAASSAWHDVTMAQLGKAAGVSRQTVYNEFGSKQGLAQAVGLEVAGRVLEDVVAALHGHDELGPALEDGLLAAFAHADSSPLVKAVLTGTGGPDGLLTVVTTDALPMLTLAGSVVSSTVLERWPDLSPHAIPTLVDSVIRLVVSHLLQPGPPREEVAAHIADLAVSSLRPHPDRVSEPRH